jgi:hypothetical protein
VPTSRSEIRKAGGEHHRRHGEDDHEARHQDRPQQERHPVERHARRALLEDRGDQLDRAGEGGDLGEGDHLRPDIGALARRIFRAGQRHIGEPAGFRTDVEQEGDPQEDAAEQIDPVAEGVEPRKGDVSRPHHQRDQIDAIASMTGTANRNIIVVPCIEKIWL